MSEDNNRPDVLEEATTALRAAPVPPDPPADLIARTIGSIQDRLPTSVPRRRVLTYLGYGSLAAAAVVGVVLFGLGGSTAAAMERALQKVAKADAVRFQVSMTIGGHTLPTNTVTVRGNKYRVEGVTQLGLTWVIDRDTKVALITNPRDLKYQKDDISKGHISPVEGIGMNFREQLLGLKGQKAEAAGAETVEGVLADRFIVKSGKAFHLEGEWNLWIGRRSGLPVKVSVQTTDNRRPMTRVYTAFDWAPATDATTFATDPPANYTEGVILNFIMEMPRKKP